MTGEQIDEIFETKRKSILKESARKSVAFDVPKSLDEINKEFFEEENEEWEEETNCSEESHITEVDEFSDNEESICDDTEKTKAESNCDDTVNEKPEENINNALIEAEIQNIASTKNKKSALEIVEKMRPAYNIISRVDDEPTRKKEDHIILPDLPDNLEEAMKIMFEENLTQITREELIKNLIKVPEFELGEFMEVDIEAEINGTYEATPEDFIAIPLPKSVNKITTTDRLNVKLHEAVNNMSRDIEYHDLKYDTDDFIGYVNQKGEAQIGSTAAVLDSGCTKTVGGEALVKNYFKSINIDFSTVEKHNSGTKFRFAGGKTGKAGYKVYIPAVVFNKKYEIEVEVLVDEGKNTPILLSTSFMTKTNGMPYLGGRRYIEANTAEYIAIHVANSGLPMIELMRSPILGKHSFNEKTRLKEVGLPTKVIRCMNIEQVEGDNDHENTLLEIRREIMKELNEIGYPTIKDAWPILSRNKKLSLYDREIVRKEAQMMCSKLNRKRAKNQSPQSNNRKIQNKKQWAALDCFDWYGKWFIMYINLHTNFTKVKKLGDINVLKEAPSASETLEFFRELENESLITESIITDEGTEFSNEKLKNYTDSKEITHWVSAGQAHHSNGTAERRIRTLKDAAHRIMENLGEIHHKDIDAVKAMIKGCQGLNALRKAKVHNNKSPVEMQYGNDLSNTMPTAEERALLDNDEKSSQEELNIQWAVEKALLDQAKSPEFMKILNSIQPYKKAPPQYEIYDKVEVYDEVARRWKGNLVVVGKESDTVYVLKTGKNAYIRRQFSQIRLKTLKIDLDFPELKLMSEHLVKSAKVCNSADIAYKCISSGETYKDADILCNFLSSDYECNGSEPKDPFMLRDQSNNPICLSKQKGYQGKTFHSPQQYSTYDKGLLKRAGESMKDRMTIIEEIASKKFDNLQKASETSTDKRPTLFRLDIKKDCPLWDLIGELLSDTEYLTMLKCNRNVRSPKYEEVWERKYDVKCWKLTKDKLIPIRPGDRCCQEDYIFQTATVSVPKTKIDVKSLNLLPEQLRSGQLPVTLQWCEEHNIGNQMKAAIIKEIESVRKNGCFDLVKENYSNLEKAMTSVLVLTLKINTVSGEIKRCKARWCARGFQDPRISDKEWRVDSETMSEISLRALLQVAANKKFHIRSYDFETAFLQGDYYKDTEEMLFMKIPTVLKTEFGFANNHICKLKKSLYGLKDAPAMWKQRLVRVLKETGFRPCHSDPCLFVLEKNALSINKPPIPSKTDIYNAEKLKKHRFREPVSFENVTALISLHVDDVLIATDDKFYEPGGVWSQITKNLKVEAPEYATEGFTFCGKFVKQDGEAFVVSQKHYVDKIQEIEIPNDIQDSDVFDLKNDKGKSVYRGIIGTLQWCVITRIDMCFGLSVAASKTNKPTWGDIRYLNKVIRHVKENADSHIRYVPMRGKMQVISVCDASFQNREGKATQHGVAVFLVQKDRNGNVIGSPFYWRTGKQVRKSHSTMGAELIAVKTASAAMHYVMGFLIEVGLIKNNHRALVLTDAADVVKTSDKSKVPTEKNLQGDLACLRQNVIDNVTRVVHLKGENNPIDVMTKEPSDCTVQMKKLLSSLKDNNLYWLKDINLHPTKISEDFDEDCKGDEIHH